MKTKTTGMRGMNNLMIYCFISIVSLLQVSCANIGKTKHKEINAPIETPLLNDDQDSQIIEHKGYVVSYNQQTRLPNWVAYELTDIEVDGNCKRNGRFYQDPDTKSIQADNEDYRNSGWDKGHIAPAGDMKWDEHAMTESCYFTNICPQNHNLNGGDWRSIEEMCRDYALQYGNLYIAAGPIVGEKKNGTIGLHKIVIPDAFYKVIMVSIDGKYEGIGFVCQNEAGHKPLNTYAKTIDEVEEITGIDFFYLLPDTLENEMEKRYNAKLWFK